MTDLTDKLLAMAALRRGAPLHDAAATEAVWLEQAADELERKSEVIQRLLAERDELRAQLAQQQDRHGREIERLHSERKVAGWFREIPSAMSYRLWQQGGHEPEPGDVALYE